MANPPISRKRIHAFHHTAPVPRRAPDGSAFLKCDECGVSIPVALMDMHNCKDKKDVKRFKGNNNINYNIKPKPTSTSIPPKTDCIPELPRSPFLFFMENYSKTCEGKTLVEIDREAIEKWKNMSFTEQWPYILKAQRVDNAYRKVLQQEEIQLSQGSDDGADSAKKGRW